MDSEAIDDPMPMASTSDDNAETIGEKLIALAQGKPNGISDADISKQFPDLQPKQKAIIINKLLSQGQIALFKQGNSLLYRFKDPSKGQGVKGADNEEKIVYSIIEQAGNEGIWIRDIRFKSNLMNTQMNKILKILETKKLIKAVKSVAAGKKRLYMLYNLEPARSVTGGAWYQDQDFEAEFVDILNQQCHRFLEEKREAASKFDDGPSPSRIMTYASSQEVLKFISDLGISKVKLSVEDLEMILDTLVLDDKAQMMISSDGNKLYRVFKSLVLSSGFTKTPCGLCPIMANCCDVGDVTPTKCEYITEWMDL
ncbi:hypothetical protein PV325_001403 [Microctonus aethiopoides]|uniref:DNA-directed RNA polymerase III subunit RPC6 n=1 Tax=Microctonus aethiopoides TaxID=144406 RepID=A0AA39F8I1_9HYME|nr:hypothetical protein PV325_001403 [Microctonus aethiopoides]KAK0098560.1 hypothetical protein PV326_006787 [Microctonus aethiopoides]KAK0164791.1 hypothetical protein PV328_003367 [Microctonus aethiopoides]